MPKKFSFTYFEKKHLRSLVKRALDIGSILDKAAIEGARIGQATGFNDPDAEFHFSDFPAIKQRVDDLLSALHSRLLSTIEQGNEDSWRLSTSKNDALVDLISSTTTIEPAQLEQWKRPNLTALAAFQGRKVAGMNLSERVWNLTGQFKSELELALEMGLGEGKSAADLSRDVRQYLNEPNKLFRRVRDAKGNLRLSKAAAAYHPGVGVYRSSYKNALRLTATENNMAYRTADYERWQQLDFVVGIVIKLSNNHPVMDICDELAGTYPKTFKFVGWHPWCRCIVIPKLSDESEFIDNLNSDDFESEEFEYSGVVTEPPVKFTQWCEDNKGRIRNGVNLPYFVKDNRAMVEGIIKAKMPDPTLTPDQARRARLAKRDDADIQRRWDERNLERINEELEKIKAKPKWYTAKANDTFRQRCEGLLSNLEMMLGANDMQPQRDLFDRWSRQNLPDSVWEKFYNSLRQGQSNWHKAYPFEMDSFKFLSAIAQFDPKKLPTEWRYEFAKTLRAINAHKLEDRAYGMYDSSLQRYDGWQSLTHHIEYANNMVRLSTSAKAKKFGLHLISTKTPADIFDKLDAAIPGYMWSCPKKKFFDSMPHFVPLRVKNTSDPTGGAYFGPSNGHVVFCMPDIKERFEGSTIYRKRLFYHEYGHATDDQLGWRTDKDIIDLYRGWKAEIAKDGGATAQTLVSNRIAEAKAEIDAWANKLQDVVNKMALEQSKLTGAEYDRVDHIMERIVDTSYRRYCRFARTYTNFHEELGAYSDCLGAALEGSAWVDPRCHGSDYFKDESNQLAEFIAHMSENFWQENKEFKRIAPELYEKMRKLIGKKLGL